MKFSNLLVKATKPFSTFWARVGAGWGSLWAFMRRGVSGFRFRSVKFEITVVYTLILGMILLVFSGVFYVILSRTLYAELDDDLTLKVQEVTYNINSYLQYKGEEKKTLEYAADKTIASEDKTLRRWWYVGFERGWFKKLDEQDLSGDFVHFWVPGQGLSVWSTNVSAELKKIFLQDTGLQDGQAKFWNIDLDTKKVRVINYPFVQDGKLSYIIQMGVSKRPVIYLLENWMTVIFISIPIFLVLTNILGWWITSRCLKPVDGVITMAQQISYEDLNLRVEPKRHYSELDRLIRAFNDMLSRLEQSFKHIGEFNAHVAHELKTPLTIIRGEAELLTLSLKSGQKDEAVETIIQEVDKMLRTIEDMLFLSKTNYQPDAFHFENIDIHELLLEIAEYAKILTAEKKLQFDFNAAKGRAIVHADKLHLRRLFLNLIDNAVKYTPAHGKIRMEAYVRGKNVFIAVTDTGPGIAEANLQRIFDQFFRGEGSQKGVGLGLSIARAIAQAHHGQIVVKSDPPHGTTFTVSLPTVQSLHFANLVHID